MTVLDVEQNDARDTVSSELFRGMAECLPVLLGIVPYALVLGAQAAQKGFKVLEVPLLTGLNFAGGSEFAAIQLWTWPPHVALIVAITFLVNSWHLLMGAALAPEVKHLPKRKIVPALYVMTDESWALTMADIKRRKVLGLPAFSMPYYLGTALIFYVAWVGFTTVGAIVGPLLGDVHAYGFDMAFPAVFLVLMRGMWTGGRAALPWDCQPGRCGAVLSVRSGRLVCRSRGCGGTIRRLFSCR